ncbi:MAG TPA: hypothetical protein VFI25_00975, partial [Planctomycetota bacterium]|nr:hypothetical protein [Planctomycetota bacterium]
MAGAPRQEESPRNAPPAATPGFDQPRAERQGLDPDPLARLAQHPQVVEDPALRAHEEAKWSLEVRAGISWRPIPAAVPEGFSRSGEGTHPLRLGESSSPGAVLLLEKPPRRALASTGALASAIQRGDVPAPPCDLRFAVWGSEIHSTGAFLRREREAGRLKGLAGVLNFDQAGFGSGDDALFVEPDDMPRNERLVRALLAVALDHRGEEGFPSRFTSNRALGGTDSYVFQEGADGPPSVTVFTSAFGSPSFVEPT